MIVPICARALLAYNELTRKDNRVFAALPA